MNGTIFLTASALIYTFITTILFIKKDKLDKVENRIFRRLLFTSVLSMTLELLITETSNIPNINSVIQKLFLVCIVFWLSIFITYTFVVTVFKNNRTENENLSKYKLLYYIFILFNIIISLAVIFSPIKVNSIDGIKYASGISVSIVFATVGIYTLIMSSLLLTHYKNINNKGYLPIIVLIILLFFAAIIQSIYPQVLLSNAVFGIIIYIMYHTIENPDLKMLRQVRAAKNRAEKANRAKSEFLSSMSHEIRTPLSTIVGLSEDIGEFKKEVPKQVSEDAEDIINASNTLLETIENILDVNNIELDKIETTKIPYNLKKEVEDLVKTDAKKLGNKPIDFKFNIAEDIPYELIGDRDRIRQVIDSLLLNSIKYTDQGEINLSIKCINQDDICNLIITVQDTGRGIKKEDINKIFSKVEILDIEKNVTFGATGLGLTITKKLIEMMGGKINVQSQPGKGSMFIVNIPQKISNISSPMDEIVIHKANDNNQNIELLNVESSPESLGSRRILIVDDNKLNIKVARRALADFDFEIDECANGAECLEMINSGNHYDLILMDIMMPVMSGETAFKKLKENPDFNTPVIALTADALVGSKEKYLKQGFIAYIAKPFNKNQIKEVIDDILGNASK